jgi:uncharacterized protein HemX
VPPIFVTLSVASFSVCYMQEQNPESGTPDPYFSKIRAIEYPPDAVVSKQIRDELAKIDEQAKNPLAKAVSLVFGLLPIGTWGVVQLEQQMVQLRREVAELRQELRELRGH